MLLLGKYIRIGRGNYLNYRFIHRDRSHLLVEYLRYYTSALDSSNINSWWGLTITHTTSKHLIDYKISTISFLLTDFYYIVKNM